MRVHSLAFQPPSAENGKFFCKRRLARKISTFKDFLLTPAGTAEDSDAGPEEERRTEEGGGAEEEEGQRRGEGQRRRKGQRRGEGQKRREGQRIRRGLVMSSS